MDFKIFEIQRMRDAILNYRELSAKSFLSHSKICRSSSQEIPALRLGFGNLIKDKSMKMQNKTTLQCVSIYQKIWLIDMEKKGYS